MSSLKIYESKTLLSSMKERAKDYQNLKEQLESLKAAFQEIVQLDDFKGKTADAIKGFYRAQIDVVNAWENFIDQHISFLKGVAGSVANRNLSGNTLVHVPFLDETLKKAAQKSNQIVADKEEQLKRIFGNINDIISLKVFSSGEFDHQMHRAEKERKDTIDQVFELDNQLVKEYKRSESAESYAKKLFHQLSVSSQKDGIVSPVHFDSKAYHNSEIYRLKKENQEQGTKVKDRTKQEKLEQETKVNDQMKKEKREQGAKAKEEKQSPWYKVVGDTLLGIVEGAWKAIVDIFKGIVDLVVALITDPADFFSGIRNAVTHPVNTFQYVWNGIETAWKRDVVNLSLIHI